MENSITIQHGSKRNATRNRIVKIWRPLFYFSSAESSGELDRPIPVSFNWRGKNDAYSYGVPGRSVIAW